MEQAWADPTDPVFLLVPRTFKEHAVTFYDRIGQPAVTFKTFWDIYVQIVAAFKHLPEDGLTETLQNIQTETEEIELLSGLRDLPHGDSNMQSILSFVLTQNTAIVPEVGTHNAARAAYCNCSKCINLVG